MYVYAVGLWTGAAIFFGAVVAPGAFQIMRPQAPDLVRFTLGRLYPVGIVAGALAALCAALLRGRRLAVQAASGAVVSAACAVSSVIMERARTEPAMHRMSTTLMGLAVIAGLVALAVRPEAERTP